MTKKEAIEYIKSCEEDDGPETREEAHEIFEAIFGVHPGPEMSHFDAWSHACSAVAALRLNKSRPRKVYQ